MVELEVAKIWVTNLTVSLPDTSERARAYSLLQRYFAELEQVELLPHFLALAQHASARQRRILADIVAAVLQPGDTWLAVLKEYHYDYCRRLARTCMKLWSEPLASDALMLGLTQAVYQRDEPLFDWLARLTLEVARGRPTVSLRPVERYLAAEIKARRGWLRKKSSLDLKLTAFHTTLVGIIAPADTPLVAFVPQTTIQASLPVPTTGELTDMDRLPLPAEQTAPTRAPGLWQKLLLRFRA